MDLDRGLGTPTSHTLQHILTRLPTACHAQPLPQGRRPLSSVLRPGTFLPVSSSSFYPSLNVTTERSLPDAIRTLRSARPCPTHFCGAEPFSLPSAIAFGHLFAAFLPPMRARPGSAGGRRPTDTQLVDGGACAARLRGPSSFPGQAAQPCSKPRACQRRRCCRRRPAGPLAREAGAKRQETFLKMWGWQWREQG